VIDGVGGFKITPTIFRMTLRHVGVPAATYFFNWHHGPPGEMLADLCCRRANQRQALKLARLLRALRRAHPNTPLHVLSVSGGTGIAVFAAEKLGRRTRVDTLILGASALSPQYDLTAALCHVRRCVAYVSRRDRILLGILTTVFGTMDRKHSASAGLRGFKWRPPAQPPAGCELGTFEQVEWTPEMAALSHHGHHVGVLEPEFLKAHVIPLLREDNQGFTVPGPGSA
jgi:pimeloyl-ACP methyl ester carboxylesterase